MEKWLLENMHAVLITVEVLWVGGFLAIFVIYFLVRRHFMRKRAAGTHPADDGRRR